MRPVEEILEQAKRLSAKERWELLDKLEDSLTEEEPKAEKMAPGEGPYARTLAAAGMGHSDFSDVSSNKRIHLAAAYAPKHADK